MSDQRLNVMPSRMVAAALKERMVAASKGHALLKRKSDAIKMKLQEVLKEILSLKRKVGSGMKDAMSAHSEAVYAAGNFNRLVIENVTNASYRVKGGLVNVAGVKIPVFERAEAEGSNQGDTQVGLLRGGEKVTMCKDSFSRLLIDLVRLSSLQSSLRSLDDALKVTNRRVNALEFVIIPQVANTIKYVQSELDELEREDTYRIKKVKDMRTRDEEIELEEMEQLEAAGLKVNKHKADEDVPSMLDEYTEAPEDNISDMFN